jgi:predicted branched-subunit amino acid permease
MANTTGARTSRTLSSAAGIGIAVGVYGVSFGVLAVAAGMSPAQACVMSMLVFTGASQFAFIGVLGYLVHHAAKHADGGMYLA